MLNVKQWRSFIAANLLAFGMMLGGAATPTSGAWGDLDSSFGRGGIIQESSTDYLPSDVAVQPDGKILVTGCKLNASGKKRFMLRRYLANGALDLGFGDNGSAVINLIAVPNTDYCGVLIKMVTNSKIAVLGYGGDKNAVWLVNPDGYGNTGFGTNGYKVLSNYPTATFTHAQLGSISGTPVIGFYDQNARVTLIRLNAGGAQDMAFGGNGESYVDLNSGPAPPSWRFVTEPVTGKITVGGLNTVSNTSEIKLERKFSNGSRDFFFNPTTIPVYHPFTRFTGIYKLADGKYIYSYYIADGAYFPSTLVRTGANGFIEESKYIGGHRQLVGIQPDGKIVFDVVYSMVRYDQYFNGQGSFWFSLDISNLYLRRYAFQPDNKMIVLGVSNNKQTLMRLLAN